MNQRGLDMRNACDYANCMSVNIQIRNVPSELHRKAKARAAMKGMSLSEFVLRELGKALEKPTREDFLKRIAAYPEMELSPGPADMIREEREDW
jgi:antitoxin FitA